jgi:DNA repair photolyase
VIKWYCPFACQKDFATGHRYCINVYTGCAHGCVYCYASAYGPDRVNTKQGFRKLIDQDMQELDRFDVPPAPVHLSNSTDPFQPLEEQSGHTRYALEQILAHRKRFSTVAILTKNPSLPVTRGYLDLFKALLPLPDDHCLAREFRQVGLPGLVVEVSLGFWREEARSFYDPYAPSVRDRVEAIRRLRMAGIPVVLRVDPLFPRSPLPSGVSLSSFGLPEAQTVEDLEHLIAFAAEVRAQHVVYSPVKVCKPRGRKVCGPMQAVRRVYEAMAAPGKLDFRGGSWRLPWPVAKAAVVEPFLRICEHHGVRAKYCKQNLIETP